MNEFPEIQYITRDDESLSHAEQALLMFKNGIQWVQIRMKDADEEAIIEEAEQAMEYAEKYNGKIIINDSIEVCREVMAHGLHLGLKDIPASEARDLVGNVTLIGGTANTLEDIFYHIEQGVDYIGLGPFRFTSTKKNLSPVLGLEGYKNIVSELKSRSIKVPVTAVGGIEMDDVASILATGIKGVAISGALLKKYKNS